MSETDFAWLTGNCHTFIGRSGAGTMAHLSANEHADAILLPLPSARGDEQRHLALAALAGRRGIIVTDPDAVSVTDTLAQLAHQPKPVAPAGGAATRWEWWDQPAVLDVIGRGGQRARRRRRRHTMRGQGASDSVTAIS